MSKNNITPAALAALVGGDVDNFLVASTPGGIERQEAEGQKMLVESTLLPKDLFPDREVWEQEGFVFGEDHDDLFVNVNLPVGWKKVATDHSMWSNIEDAEGLPRVAIFYKAAFYDRRANATLRTVELARSILEQAE